MTAKYNEKDMEIHREYMKKYKMQSSDLGKEKIRYRDHYEVLGVPRNATHKEIRQAYHRLARKYHPDRDPSPAAQERWEGVPAAYAVISSPNDRMEYDATLPTRDALVEFYKAYNPAKLDNATIQTIIDGWYGREVELFQMLNAKYEIAPHQGTNKSLQRASMALPLEKARTISRDSIASTTKDGEVAMTWTDSIGSALCCKGVFSRVLSKAYYEVETQSPGFIVEHGPSETPGQPINTNIQSPAPLPEHLATKSNSPEPIITEKKPTAVDVSSGSLVEEGSCSSTTSSNSSTDDHAKIAPAS